MPGMPDAGLSDWISSIQANVPELKINHIDRGQFVFDERVAPPQVNTFAWVIDAWVTPEDIDRLVTFMRESALPQLLAQPGFRGALLSANRETGRALTNTIWETAASMEGGQTVNSLVQARAQELAGESKVTAASYEAVLLLERTGAPV